MSDRSKIEWTDASWNVITGCDEVSPGCDHCYAKTFAERWRGIPGHHFENGFDVQLRPDKLDLPLNWRKPRKIFVNSMSDLFHKDVPDAYIAQVFAVMALARQHTFQVLTKRHGRMRSLLGSEKFQRTVSVEIHRQKWAGDVEAPAWHWPLRNVWMGVSVEDQKWADLRIPALLETPASVRFLSCEPLLGPVDLSAWTVPNGTGLAPCIPDLHWVIAGGESGDTVRPMHPNWARSLRDQCVSAGVAYHFKQWGEWSPQNDPYRDPWDDEDRHVWMALDGTTKPFGALTGTEDVYPVNMHRVGKRAAGRLLDGRTWDEYPAGVA